MSKKINPNEASLLRWTATIIIGYLLGTLLTLPWILLKIFYPNFLLNSPFGFMADFLDLMMNFVFLFLGTVIAIKWIAKTSLRDFILGEGGSVNKKDCLIVLLLYSVGFAIVLLTDISYISLRGLTAQEFLLLLLCGILLVWMQTSWEELIFRGIFIRYACKNDIKLSKKAVLFGIISSFLFMLIHITNPEVLSQSGFEVFGVLLTYAIPGFGFYFANIYFKNLLPGLLMHWLNNFTLFVFFSGPVTAGGSPSLFIYDAPISSSDIFYTIFLYVPLYLYMGYQIWKQKKTSNTIAS